MTIDLDALEQLVNWLHGESRIMTGDRDRLLATIRLARAVAKWVPRQEQIDDEPLTAFDDECRDEWDELADAAKPFLPDPTGTGGSNNE